MSHRHGIPALAGLLAAAALLSACGGASVVEPTPLAPLEAPAYAMQTVWQTDTGEGAGEYVSGFAPAVSGDRVYVANRDGYVMALALDDGERLWRSRTGDRLISGPTLADDTLLMGTRDGEVVALSARSGQRRWTAELSSEVIAAPAANDTTAVARTLDGRVVALDMANGNRRWTIERSVPRLTMRGVSSPQIVGNTVYAGLDNGQMIALNLDNGEQRWEQAIALPSGRSELERIVDIDATPLVRNSEIYAVSAGGALASLALSSGRLRWKIDVAAETGLAYDRHNIFTTDMDSVVWAVNRITGAENWTQDRFKYRELSAPVVYDGDLLVGDLAGYLHWLATDDGSEIARGQPFGEAIRAAPVVAGDRVIVLGAEGEVAAVRFTAASDSN